MKTSEAEARINRQVRLSTEKPAELENCAQTEEFIHIPTFCAGGRAQIHIYYLSVWGCYDAVVAAPDSTNSTPRRRFRPA